jgi:hypothetical protein
MGKEREELAGLQEKWGTVFITAIMLGPRTHGSVRTRATTAIDRSSELLAAPCAT